MSAPYKRRAGNYGFAPRADLKIGTVLLAIVLELIVFAALIWLCLPNRASGMTNEMQEVKSLVVPALGAKRMVHVDLVAGEQHSITNQEELQQITMTVSNFLDRTFVAFEPTNMYFEAIATCDLGTQIIPLFANALNRTGEDKAKHFGASYALAGTVVTKSLGHLASRQVCFLKTLRIGVVKEMADKGYSWAQINDVSIAFDQLEMVTAATLYKVDKLELDEGDLNADLAGNHLYWAVSTACDIKEGP